MQKLPASNRPEAHVLSAADRRLLLALSDSIRAHHQSPTLAELAADLKITRNAVWQTVTRLRGSKHLIPADADGWRNLKFTQKGRAAVREIRKASRG